MKNDFKPVVGHSFNLRGEWGGVLDCEVLAVEPNKTLSYTWNFAHDDAAFDLKSVVTFTLTPTRHGNASAHGAIGLPAGPEAGLWRRQTRLAEILRESRTRGGRPVMSRGVASRYQPVLVALHWLVALMIIGLLCLGFFVLANMPNSDPKKLDILVWHMSGGMFVLVLMVVRLIIRRWSARPAMAVTGSPLLDRWPRWRISAST